MRRSEMLKVVGLSTTAFNSLVQRDLLPFPPQARSRVWGDYGADDLVRLGLMLELTRGGRPQKVAVQIVRRAYRRLLRDAANAKPPSSDYCIGAVWYRDADKPTKRIRRALVGKISDLPAQYNDLLIRSDRTLIDLSIVNASEVVRSLVERAEAIGAMSPKLSAIMTTLHAFGPRSS